MLLVAGSVERRELRFDPALASEDRNTLASLRRKRLLHHYSQRHARRVTWPEEELGPEDMPPDEVAKLPEEVIRRRIRWHQELGPRRWYWTRPHLMRTPLGDAVVELYRTQLASGERIRWDPGALREEILRTCPNR
jgi:hypothetical protein